MEQQDIKFTARPNFPAKIATFRPIDKAVMDFLGRQFPQAKDEHLLVAGLLSTLLAEGHLCLPQAKFITFAQQYEETQTLTTHALKNNPLLSHKGLTPIIEEDGKLYLYRYWNLEQSIAQHTKARLSDDKLAFDPAILQPLLERLFPLEDSQALPYGMSHWQKIATALVGRKRFGIITGGPGTGKTTTVVKLLALHLLYQKKLFQKECPKKEKSQHENVTHRPLKIELAAPTGKAAARLSEAMNGALAHLKNLGIEEEIINALPHTAKTIHRLLKTKKGSRHFYHNEANSLQADLVVIDEASMIDVDLMDALLRAVSPQTTLILVGDKDQLASVEAGAIMHELCAHADLIAYSDKTLAFLEACAIPIKEPLNKEEDSPAFSPLKEATVKLRHSWRAENKEIIDLANQVNQQDFREVERLFSQAPTILKRYKISELGRNIPLPSEPTNHLTKVLLTLTDYKESLEALFKLITLSSHSLPIETIAKEALITLARLQVLTPLREGPYGVNALNQLIRASIIQHFKPRFIYSKTPPHSLFLGEPILVTHNLYELGVMNGDIGIVLNHPRFGLRLAFSVSKAQKEEIIFLLPEQIEGYYQGAYALTVHQSQGSEYDHVFLLLPSQFSPLLTKELLYTAITRAKKSFTLIETARQQDFLLKKIIETKTERFSGLNDLLTKFKN